MQRVSLFQLKIAELLVRPAELLPAEDYALLLRGNSLLSLGFGVCGGRRWGGSVGTHFSSRSGGKVVVYRAKGRRGKQTHAPATKHSLNHLQRDRFWRKEQTGLQNNICTAVRDKLTRPSFLHFIQQNDSARVAGKNTQETKTKNKRKRTDTADRSYPIIRIIRILTC